MRHIRRLALSAAILGLLLPAIASAQVDRRFENSWFWGVKGGTAAFWTTRTTGVAPLLGVETLITRRRAALYISLDQTLFSSFRDSDVRSTVPDPELGEQEVGLGDMRRLSAQVHLYPRPWSIYRPYVGIGFAMNHFEEVRPLNGFNSQSHEQTVRQMIDERRTRSAPLLTAGLHAQLLRLSVYGSASWMPAQIDFLLNDNETYFFEFGARYNIGTSIDRP